MSAAIILLGASGRLGRAAFPRFTDAGFDVIGVGRSRPEPPPPGDWITADLTDAHHQQRLTVAIDRVVHDHGRVWLVDSVLDRSDVNAMRRSVSGATSAVLRLYARVAAGGRWCGLIAASTTAVLALGPHQTPYGLAKRHQVITYARSDMAGVALLLPQLVSAVSAGRPGCSFDDAARLLVEAAVTDQQSGFVLHVPALPTGTNTFPSLALRSAVTANLRCLWHHTSMQAHRDAAHGRLRLTPERLRNLVDHHQASPVLLRRLARRYHVTVTDGRDDLPAAHEWSRTCSTIASTSSSSAQDSVA